MAAAKVARRSIRHDVPVHTGEGARLVVSIVLGAVLGGCWAGKGRDEQAHGGEGNDAVKHWIVPVVGNGDKV